MEGHHIKDKVVLITGANRGIGKAFVDISLKHEAKKVYAAVRNLDSAKIFQGQERVVPLYIDLSKHASIERAAKEATDVSVVINNAGVLTRTNPLSPDAVANLQKEMSVNVYGLMRMAQEFAGILKLNGGGVFVQMNSVASLRCGSPEVSTYSASKAAAYSMTMALRQTMKETRIVSVHPGPIATDMIKETGLANIAEPPEQVAEEVLRALLDPSVLHVHPDSNSKRLGQAYSSFSTEIIEPGRMY